jgi:hypothetical protein
MTQPRSPRVRSVPRAGDTPARPSPAGPGSGEALSLADQLRFLDRRLADLEANRDLLGQALHYLATAAEQALLDPHAAAQARAIAAQATSRHFHGLTAWATAISLYQRGTWDQLYTQADTAATSGWATCLPAALAATSALHRDDEYRAQPYLQYITEAARHPATSHDAHPYQAWTQSLALRRAGRDHDALDCLLTGPHPAATWPHDTIYSPRLQATRLAAALADDHALRKLLTLNNHPGLHPATQAHCHGLAHHDPAPLTRAAALYQQAGHQPHLAQATEDLALLHAQNGNHTAARPPMGQAIRLYHTLGATWDLHRARANARTYNLPRRPGAQPPPPPPAGPASRPPKPASPASPPRVTQTPTSPPPSTSLAVPSKPTSPTS